MEHLNKCTKGQDGICGITSHPKTLLKYCLTGPELARLVEEAERLTAVSSSGVMAQQHHCISQAKVRRQEQAIAKLKKVLIFKRSCAQANLQTGQMFKLLSKEIVPQSVQKSILSTEKVGMRPSSGMLKHV